MGDVVVNIRGKLDPSVARAMRGVSDAQRRADREALESRRKLAAEKKKADQEEVRNKRKAEQEKLRIERQASRDAATIAKQTAREKDKSERDSVRAVQRAEAEKRREIERTNREAARSAQHRAREESRAQRGVDRINQRVFSQRLRQGVRSQREARDMRADIAGTVTGTATGLAVGGLAAAMAYNAQRQQQLQGWLGAQDSDAVLAMAGDLQMVLMRLATQGGRAKEQLDGFVQAMSGFGAPVQESAQMLEDAQNQFTNQVDTIIANAPQIGRAAFGLGASPSDVMKIGALGVRDMGISQRDYDEAIALAMASTDKGGVEAAGLGTYFQGSIGAAAATFHSQGLEGMRQWAVGAQLAPASGRATQAEQAHAYENFMQRLAMSDVREGLEAAGIDVTTGADGKGALRDQMSVLRAFANSSIEAGPLQEILGDINATQYAQGLRRAGNARISELYDTTTVGGGNALIDSTFTRIGGSQAGQNAIEQAQRQNTIFAQSEDAYRVARDESGYVQDYKARHATENSWLVSAKANAVSFLDRMTGWQDSADDWMLGLAGRHASPEVMQARQQRREGIRGMLSDGPSSGGGGKTPAVTLSGTPTVSLSSESIAAITRAAPQSAGQGNGGGNRRQDGGPAAR